jgi:glutaminase
MIWPTFTKDFADKYGIWFILAGSVSVIASVRNDRRLRVASLGQSTTVGEMTLIEHGVRTADIVADKPLACLELALDTFDRHMRDHPRLASRLLTGLCGAITADCI